MDNDNQYGCLNLQRHLLVLLKEFDSFCKINGIVYSLDSGSLLGAIRHDGFIPWDNDIDVVMDRKNRDQLLREIGLSDRLRHVKELWIDKIRFKDSTDKELTLDIFILDHAPDNSFKRKIKLLKIIVLQGMIKEKPKSNRFGLKDRILLSMAHSLGQLFSYERKLKWYERVSNRDNGIVTEYSSCYNYNYKEIRTLFHSNTLDNIIEHPFEDMLAPITADYDYYLRALYGDYMTPQKKSENKLID